MMLFALNFLSVFIYGLLIMVFLLNIKMNKKNAVALSAYLLVNVLFQLTLYFILGGSFLEKAYPFAVHLPLLVFFCTYFNKRFDWALFVLCTAYILTTPRRWSGDLVALLFNNNQTIAAVSQILVSIPLLFFIYKYLRPYITKILEYSGVKLRLLVIVPFIYYVIAYLTTVYTQLLYDSKVVVIGILTTGLTLVFYYFLVAYFKALVSQFQMQNEQNILAVQISALQARAETMKQEEENAMIHRHDLRHHLNLISGHLKSGSIAEAQSYITEIEKNIDSTATVKYCENKAVNLIVSSYLNMAKAKGIRVKSHIHIPQSCRIADMDLCIILANAIENAINACMNVKAAENRKIDICSQINNSKLLIEITNSFEGALRFEKDMPVTDKDYHGFGTKSIAATIEKYKGIYSFSVKDETFTLNAIL